jgi:hypothetical protein
MSTKKYFPEEDIMSLAYGILSALSFLQKYGIPHGNLCSSEIYFDVCSSCFKILDADLVRGKAAGIVHFLVSGRFIPLSPEFMVSISTHSDIKLTLA